jgi:hypothetical protein
MGGAVEVEVANALLAVEAAKQKELVVSQARSRQPASRGGSEEVQVAHTAHKPTLDVVSLEGGIMYVIIRGRMSSLFLSPHSLMPRGIVPLLALGVGLDPREGASVEDERLVAVVSGASVSLRRWKRESWRTA